MSDKPNTLDLPQAELREILDKVRKRVKKHPIVKKMFKKYKVDIDEFDLIPMAFAHIDVSARTDHGIIYFNIKLVEDGFEDDDHYIVHEITHFLQQTTGNKPTQGAEDGDYLENKEEIEGFNNQTEYIADVEGDDAADDYVEQVLDHHDVHEEKDREKKKKDLNKGSDNRIRYLKLLALAER